MAFLLGLQSARTSTEVLQDIIQEQRQQCPTFSCQQIIGDGINIEADKGSKISGITFRQECRISGECLFNGFLSNLAKSIQKAEATAKGGLGWSFAEAEEKANTIIRQIQEQKCGGIVSEQVIAKPVNIKSSDGSKITDVNFEQIADQKLRCLYQSIAENIVKNEQIAAASASGLDPTAIFGMIIAVVLIGGLIFLATGKGVAASIPPAGRKAIGGLVAVIILGGLGLGGYWIYENKIKD